MYLIAASAEGDIAISLSGAPPHGDSQKKKDSSSRAFEPSVQIWNPCKWFQQAIQ